jgi:hypothetical protein
MTDTPEKLVFRAMIIDVYNNRDRDKLPDVDASLQLMHVAMACLMDAVQPESVVAALDVYRRMAAEHVAPNLETLEPAGKA